MDATVRLRFWEIVPVLLVEVILTSSWNVSNTAVRARGLRPMSYELGSLL